MPWPPGRSRSRIPASPDYPERLRAFFGRKSSALSGLVRDAA
jgi:hypothetical protein